MKPTLIVMVKAPQAGRVKTRLARDMGAVGAVWWYRHQVQRLLRRLQDPRWNTVLAVAPDSACAARFWPKHLMRLPQGRGDLGQRMVRMLHSPARGPVVLIGSDIPGVTRGHIRCAFEALGHSDAVFGPATDGGYWLIGLRRGRATPPGFCRGVRWSGPHALSDTVSTLGGLSHSLCDTLQDVDTVADLRCILA